MSNTMIGLRINRIGPITEPGWTFKPDWHNNHHYTSMSETAVSQSLTAYR